MTRILQLSDTHIVDEGRLAYGVADTAALLEKAVAHLNAILPLIGPVDVLAVTGDLTDFGTPEAYRRFQALMAPLEIPYVALPGNHDDREAMRAAFASEPWMPESGPLNLAVAFDDILVLGLDTLVPGEPYGALSGETLDWLDAELNRHPDKPVLIAMHHPPFDIGIGHMDAQRLKTADILYERLASVPPHVTITCGHVHRFAVSQIRGLTVITVPSPSHAVALDMRADAPAALMMEPGGIVLHDVRGGSIVSQLIPIGPFEGPYAFDAAALEPVRV
ncbi:MAG: phosphodiesterase [Hyphomicrobiales bacterium]|nr:phosphodiesterase [Hyphomicrobiales bacterium]